MVGARTRPRTMAFAIFEGGGAKGITHIGALKALRETHQLVGTAGASAGAIVAVLAALGFRAEDIFDDDGGDDVLKRHGHTPTSLLGIRDWTRAEAAMRRLPLIWATAFYAVAVFTLALSLRLHWMIAAVSSVVLVLCLAPAIRLLFLVVRHGGVFATSTMRDAVEAILRERVEEMYRANGVERSIGEFLTFADISDELVPEFCKLRVVATDPARQRLVQFDETTPGVSVTDAVIASAALPIVLRPSRIRGAGSDRIYVDGGMVSNLPAWAFMTDKRILERKPEVDYRVPVYAFTLDAVKVEEPAAPVVEGPSIGGWRRVAMWPIRAASRLGAAAWRILLPVIDLVYYLPFRLVSYGYRAFRPEFNLLEHLGDVVSTGIWGSQTVAQRLVQDLRVVRMSSPLTTAQFGCTRAQASRAYRMGYSRAVEAIGTYERQHRENLVLLRHVLAQVHVKLAGLPVGEAGSRPQFRLQLVERVKPGLFRVAASVGGAPEDADDRMELDAGNAGAATVFSDGLSNIATYLDGPGSIRRSMSKYERVLVRPDRASVISVPVFFNRSDGGGEDVDRVLTLDADVDLDALWRSDWFSIWLEQRTLVFQRDKEVTDD